MSDAEAERDQRGRVRPAVRRGADETVDDGGHTERRGDRAGQVEPGRVPVRLTHVARAPAAAAATPNGMLMNSTHRHDAHSVSRPPTTSPIAKPPVAMPDSSASARTRSRASVKVVVIRAMVFGPAAAAPMPWRTRAAMSQPAVGARPPISEATVNSTMPPTKSRRRPEHVAGAAAEQQQPAEGQRVGAHHPRQAGRGEVQRGLDVRERHVHHGGVDGEHELADDDDRESEATTVWRRGDGCQTARGQGCLRHRKAPGDRP